MKIINVGTCGNVWECVGKIHKNEIISNGIKIIKL